MAFSEHSSETVIIAYQSLLYIDFRADFMT